MNPLKPNKSVTASTIDGRSWQTLSHGDWRCKGDDLSQRTKKWTTGQNTSQINPLLPNKSVATNIINRRLALLPSYSDLRCKKVDLP